MSVLELAAALVCSFEGFRPSPYQDTAGVWTIGYGSTRWTNGDPVSATNGPIDESTARSLMETELAPIVVAVTQQAPDGAGAGMIAACSSFAYNEGLRAFLGSTLCAEWRKGEIALASDQFLEWVYDHDPVTHKLVEVAGLRNRREKERAVFLGAVP